uniref:AT3G52170-like helix-turn-helix domain-containing protein n=1 Tax=Kalanchoe fedtschenkoi TaxID=63787 RepID=A0A7N0TXH9_KALFE
MYRALRLLSRHSKPHCTLPRAISPANSTRIMHAFKGGWARQTFALAKSNDKVEKKSGVRLSKKERRVMVESFIKTYQSLNNGTFPSVHATHKEVGGSYYIVREIVRDIIQENKVLAPPKVRHKQQNSFPGDYPVGSIALEPQVSSILLPNGMHESDHEVPAGEVIIEFENSTDQSIDENLTIGQNASAGKLEEQVRNVAEVNESLFQGLDDSEKSKLYETVEQIEPSGDMITKIAKAVEVETFPLQATMKLNESLNTSSEDTTVLNSTTPEVVADHADPHNNFPIGSLVDLKAGPGKVGKTADEQKLHKPSEIFLETFNYVSSKEGVGADVKGSDGQKDILFHGCLATGEVEQSQELATGEHSLSSNTTAVKNLTGTISASIMKSNQPEVAKSEHGAFQPSTDGTSDSFVKSSEQEATKVKCEDVQSSTGPHRDRKPTMDRINLESWEETSRKPAHEGSPFSAFVKACVAVVSKLWSK